MVEWLDSLYIISYVTIITAVVKYIPLVRYKLIAQILTHTPCMWTRNALTFDIVRNVHKSVLYNKVGGFESMLLIVTVLANNSTMLLLYCTYNGHWVEYLTM